jgi:hypothetical protein
MYVSPHFSCRLSSRLFCLLLFPIEDEGKSENQCESEGGGWRVRGGGEWQPTRY